MNTELSILNLSGNKIKKISNLQNLTKLENFYIDKNLIEDIENLRGLLECPSISAVLFYNLVGHASKLYRERPY
jgi:Leucine-rich repeat (LRR) protein